MSVGDIITVTGRDAESYLQGQLSQDITKLAPGDVGRSLLLEPTGKLGFWMTIERVEAATPGDPDAFELGVDAGYGDAVVERINRFKLRTKIDVVLTPAPAHDDESNGRDELDRIRAGIPRMGAELVMGETIPAEMGQWFIDRSVSFTKGCYTGQELVARIDSRGGNVPRHLRGLTIEGTTADGLPVPGAELTADGTADGKVVGRLTSVAWDPERGQAVALGLVGRAIEVPAVVTVAPGFTATVTQAPEPGPVRGAS